MVPKPAEVLADQGSLSTLLSVQSQPAAPAPLPVFGSVQSPLTAPTLTYPAPVNPAPTPALFSPSVQAPSPTKVLDTAPIPVQDLAPAPAPDAVPALTQAPVPAVAAAPPEAPPQVETVYIGSQGREEAPDQVLIEDLGPDDEENVIEKRDGEGNKEEIVSARQMNGVEI